MARKPSGEKSCLGTSVHIHMVIPGLNSKVLDKLVTTLRLQSAVEQLPTSLVPTIQPVIDATPDPEMRPVSAVLSDATSQVITNISTNPKKTLFIYALFLSVSKDASSDATYATIEFAPKGKAATTALSLRLEPSTAAQGLTTSIEFPTRIQLERGTAITITTDSGTASIDASGIAYLEVENK